MKVITNLTLIIGNREKLPAGHMFAGQLEDFPEDIQSLIKVKSPYLTVVEDSPVEQKEVLAKKTPKKNPVVVKGGLKVKTKPKTKLLKKRKSDGNS